ncbi:MAG: NAD(P)/FAD-dependent oxidoreductase [Patescibacteria group bacterium]|nr:NAD(P)/FAD-dependent oxidoreductase [Patescibacteria group bacterium]
MKVFDVIIIGAGASGLMAAGRAAELGASALLLEKNNQPGIKLLMSGGGRCNFTNYSSNNIFAKALGENGKWLLSALNYFGPQEVINFFEERGVATKIEDNNRVLPFSNQAKDILDVLLEYNRGNGVQIKTGISVKDIILDNNEVEKVILADGSELRAKKYIIATGGGSYPLSGSSGDAYVWLKSLGHSLVKPRPALSQIYIKKPPLVLEGLSLDHVFLRVIDDKKKIGSESGAIIFTSRGISGPAAINLSRHISSLSVKKLKLEIDFLPALKNDELDLKIREIVSQYPRYNIKNILAGIIPKRLLTYLLASSNLDNDLKGDNLTRSQRLNLVEMLKGCSLDIMGVGDFNEAMITSGGLSLKEVDGRTMNSKIISNLYFAGECLDLDGPTGGYNLQIAWSTGFVAGESAATRLD